MMDQNRDGIIDAEDLASIFQQIGMLFLVETVARLIQDY